MPKGIPNHPVLSAERLLSILSPGVRRAVLREVGTQRRRVERRIGEIERELARHRRDLMDLNGRMMWLALTGDDGPLRTLIERREGNEP